MVVKRTFHLLSKLHLVFLTFLINFCLTFKFYLPEDSLHKAAYEGNLKKVKLLIKQDYDVNKRHESKFLQVSRTALDYASWSGYYDVVEYLVKNGAEVHNPDPYNGLTALTKSVQTSPEVTTFLLKNGAKINHITKGGNNALFFAVGKRRKGCPQSAPNKDVVHILLENGADKIINHQNKDGYTALMYACKCASFKIVELLLEAGADPNIVSNGGRWGSETVYAMKTNRKEIRKLLIQYGAKE